jgi:hypothetical protein
MGKTIEIYVMRDVIQLSLVRGQTYPHTGKQFGTIRGSDGRLLAYEVMEIENIEPADIPEIVGKYDVAGTDIKDMTIREIVMAVKEQVLR